MSNENNTLPMASEAGQQLIQQAIQALQMASTGDLNQLTTQAKTSLVAAINELNTLTDVKVNGISVVDENKTAQIQSYKEVTLAEYQALPDSKLTDNIMYCITDVGRADQFPPLIYSDEEREVGVWRDGKPLYQKTIVTDQLPNNETKNIPHNISNIDKIVNIEAVTHAKLSVDANNTFTSVPRIQDNNTTNANMGLDVTATNIVLKGRSSSTNFSSIYEYVMVTLWYTKTTDTAGSGIWTTQGGYSHHYSTNEKVIGTWIDGKPLYEKSYIYENSSGSSGDSSGAVFDVWNLGSEKVIISDGLQCTFVNLTTNKMYPLPYADSAFTNVYIDNGIVKLRVRNDDWGSNYKLYMTARYTKTTD